MALGLLHGDLKEHSNTGRWLRDRRSG